jgi:metallo-beta-lactamase family protein
MRIQFCGADRTVTGSSHLLEINGKRILLDCGMYQGPRDEANRLNQLLPEDAKTIDAVVLSHGHLDHCGKLPVLCKGSFAGPIYCTPATAEVARIVLEDSAKIQAENAGYLNQRARNPSDPKDAAPVRPIYLPQDVQPVIKRFRTVPYKTKTTLGNDISFTFFDAGHILGSAYVLIEYAEAGQQRTLLFTADVGRYDTPILNDPAPLPGPVDFVITESTYGNKSHGPMAEIEPQLLAAVQGCIARKSRLLVPSFAIGRTQTVLWYMNKFIEEKKIPAIPLYVDSPMGVEVSRVYSKFRDDYDEQTRALIGTRDLFGLSRVTFAQSIDDSKKINADRGPCVIIASSPTCEFGRILHHLTQSIERQDDLIIFVGWIPPGTLGRRLQDGEKRVRILDRWYDLRCRVQTIHGLSAHADGDELLRFLSPTLNAKTSAFVVHGEVDQAEAFAARLMAGGMRQATVPAMETSVLTLSSGSGSSIGSKGASEGAAAADAE